MDNLSTGERLRENECARFGVKLDPGREVSTKAATTMIPIVFGVGEDPVKLNLVASLAWPGGNATGINFFANEVVAKRLRLLRELVPKVARIAVFVNPGNPSVAATTMREVQEAAPTIGMKTQIFNTATIGEINAAFATFERERPDALFVAGDAFFVYAPAVTASSSIPSLAWNWRSAVKRSGPPGGNGGDPRVSAGIADRLSRLWRHDAMERAPLTRDLLLVEGHKSALLTLWASK